MVKSYQELAGATGRAQQFRRRRHDAATLFKGETPDLFFDDRQFELRNISGSGAGAIARGTLDEPENELDRVGVLRLIQRGQEIFRGPARCARTELSPGRLFSGFALDNDEFDLASLVVLNARAVAKSDIRASWRTAVTAEYRAFCSDIVAFVGAHCARIDRVFGPIEKAMSEAERREVFDELLAAAESDWRDLLLQGNGFALAARDDKDHVASMKRYTEAAVTPVLIGGASWRRCYEKPMGYPGDFRIMNYMYDRRPEGSSIRETFLHGLGLIAGRPIYTRMLKLSEIIVGSFRNRAPGGDWRTASIGCGPARELETIAEGLGPRSRFVATLIDQEVEALDYAVEYARRRLDERRLGIRAFNTTFKTMFNPSAIADLTDQDVIYSLGLVDYFSPLLARRFVSRAYDLLSPGGMVVIGNASDSPNGTYWTMEHILDWPLFFRNRSEMADLAADIEGARVKVESDPLDSIYFLVVEKPA